MRRGRSVTYRFFVLNLLFASFLLSCDSAVDPEIEEEVIDFGLSLENFFPHEVGEVLNFDYSDRDYHNSPNPSYSEEGTLSIEFLTSEWSTVSIPHPRRFISGLVFSVEERRLGSRRTTKYDFRDGQYGYFTDTLAVTDTLYYDIVREQDGFVHFNPSEILIRYLDPFPTLLKSVDDEVQFIFGATGGGCYRSVTLDRNVGFKGVFNSCKFGLSRDTWFSMSRLP